MTATPFRVAITADGASPDGSSIFGDLGLDRLTERGVEWQVLPRYLDPLPVDDLTGFHAVLSLGHTTFDAGSVCHLRDLQLIARFGAGFESVDLAACTRAGVAVTNTPDGVRRPLALAALTLVLSLAHNLPAKDRITRTGRWSDRSQYRGHGIDGKVLGIVGFGSVGADLAGLCLGLGFTVIGSNRSGQSTAATALGVALMEVDELLRVSDYVVLTASLNDDSRGMIDARRIALMKPDAYFVNVARGGLVDQRALTAALIDQRIAGAALDVFEVEPIASADALLCLDTVIVTPHSLPWTEEFTRDVSRSAIASILAVAAGETPHNLLNPEVLTTARWARTVAAPRRTI
ncbi:MAG: glyoxylate reductase [Microbacteriaceae bacterium]|nr:glyoxylate reductase [Microbacteriaceae bacterium]